MEINKAALDRHITGNYGEDQFKTDPPPNQFDMDTLTHFKGPACVSCWMSHPVPCKCGGWVHAEFGDENRNGDYWLALTCDTCGSQYEEVET